MKKFFLAFLPTIFAITITIISMVKNADTAGLGGIMIVFIGFVWAAFSFIFSLPLYHLLTLKQSDPASRRSKTILMVILLGVPWFFVTIFSFGILLE